MNYVYILRCSDGSLYCGWTTDLQGRLRKHNQGKGARYTRSRLPVEMIYHETYADRHEALSREWQIKQMKREDKLRLIGQASSEADRQEGQKPGDRSRQIRP